jgi:hypothetical protein
MSGNFIGKPNNDIEFLWPVLVFYPASHWFQLLNHGDSDSNLTILARAAHTLNSVKRKRAHLS